MERAWIPSHLRVIVHQARELALKSKGVNSEVYTTLQIEEEKLQTTPVSCNAPFSWNQTFDIPLMSLDSDLNLTVRQKARLGSDAFVGYFHIPLSSLHLSNQPIKNWYKLGPKPGKVSAKLRGDLLVTIQFLSSWSRTEKTIPYSNPLELEIDRRQVRMLRRTKSEHHSKTNRDPFRNGDKSSRPKEKIGGVFKRSFRKKNSQVFEECDDDFVSLAVHSPDSPPTPRSQNNRKKLLKQGSSSRKGGMNSEEDSSSESFTQSESSTQSSLTSNSLVMFSEASKLNKSSGVIDLWRADPDVRREMGRKQLEESGRTDRDERDEREDSEQNKKKQSPIFKSKVYHHHRPQSMHSLPVSFKNKIQDNPPVSSPEEASTEPRCILVASNSNNHMNSPVTDSPSPTITYRAHSIRRLRKRGNSINQDASTPENHCTTPGDGLPVAEDMLSNKDSGVDGASGTIDQSSSTSGYFSGSSTLESVTPATVTGQIGNDDTLVDSMTSSSRQKENPGNSKPSQKESKLTTSDGETRSELMDTVSDRTSGIELHVKDVDSRLADESHPISPTTGTKHGLRPRVLPFTGPQSSVQVLPSTGRKRVSRATSLAGDNFSHRGQEESEKLLPEAVPLRKKRAHTRSLGVSTNFDRKRLSADIAELRKLNKQSNTDGLGNIMSLGAPLRDLLQQKKTSEPLATVATPTITQTGSRSSRATTHPQVPPTRVSKQNIPAPRAVKPHSSALHNRGKTTASIKSDPSANNSGTCTTTSLESSVSSEVSCTHDNQETETPPVETESLDSSRSTTPSQLVNPQHTPPSSAPASVSVTEGGQAPPITDGQRKISDEQMRRLKHTVAYKKSQGKPVSGVSLLPPSVSSKSATLPSRGKFAGPNLSFFPTVPTTQAHVTTNVSTSDTRPEVVTPAASPIPTPTPDPLSPVSELPSVSSSQPLSPVGEGEDPSLHEDALLPVALSPIPGEAPVHRSSTSSVPSSTRTVKTFMDSGTFQSRKQGGGLKRAMSLYQESKRQVALVKEKMVLEAGVERATHSAGNSPRVRRKETFDGVNSLRRMIMRHGRVATPPLVVQANGSRSSTPDSTVAGGTSSPLSFHRTSDTHSHVLRFPSRVSSASPAPNDSASGLLTTATVSNGPSRGPAPRPSRESIQSTASSTAGERRSRLSKGYSSSFEKDEKSTEEEDELTEEVLQGWSKEDLIHDLLKTRSQLKTTRKDSASLQEYLGDLLAKVMEHSPELLQCTHLEH